LLITAGGADAGLEAETSNNLTVGVILQPELSDSIGDISFAVDYFKIEVENGVSRRCHQHPAAVLRRSGFPRRWRLLPSG
jgi:hypothetical protein